MKIKYFLLAAMLTICGIGEKAAAQTPYADAIALRALISGSSWPADSRDAVADILAHYCRKDEVNFHFFAKNPFIVPLSGNFSGLAGLVGDQNTPPALTGLAGLDVTKYADAIADLMIERAKEELTVSFFNRFVDFAKKHPEFQILFPKTTANLTGLLTFTYPQMLPALRTGFLEDLKKITYNLDDVLQLPAYAALLKNFPEVKVAIRSVKLIHELETGSSNAADIIKEYAEFPEFQTKSESDAFNNIAATVRFGAVFSESLRSADANKIWIDSKQVKELVKDNITTQIFMGLVYRKIENADSTGTNPISFAIDSAGHPARRALTDIIGEQQDNILLYQSKITKFISLADKIMPTYNEIADKTIAHQKLTPDDVSNYIDVTLDVADYGFSLAKIFSADLKPDEYLSIVRKTNSLYKSVNGQHYTQAVNDAIDILQEVNTLTKASATSDAQRKKIDEFSAVIDKIKPYGLFMGNMVEAKTSEDVKAALENVILPVGSSSIKKNSQFNISVQTYLGAYLNSGKILAEPNTTWASKFGVIAPIGISITPGFLSQKKYGSISFFGSLLDLGAIVDYKLKKDSTVTTSGADDKKVVSKDYSVKLGQIFSPGAYLVYGFFGNLPLSLGFGAQYGPGLGKIQADGNTIINNPKWRWNFFLAVDLPFFTLTNKMKHK
jgi:hypothetical protein